jgi:putative spermidine/putrescine transport system ATP-binding protein
MALPDPIVRFRSVGKTLGGQAAVRDLSLDIERGEFLTLLGPSGAGKTTTLNLLAGFAAPDAGEILLEGRPVTRTPAHRRGIGVVFQSYALFPHLSVAENVGFPLAVRGVKRAERAGRVAETLAMVRLAEFGARRPGDLSGGQQQRVALARALVFRPSLLLLDEPLAALDPGLRQDLQEELRRLHRALGITILHVTHDQAEALALSDRIAVMHEGALRQVGPPEALYEDPADAFVAGFIGENNRLAGATLAIEEDFALVRLDAGPTIEARAAAGLEAGVRCVVCIRPERIALAAAEAAEMGEAAIDAVVQEAVYLGDHLRLRLALAGGSATLLVKRPSVAGMAGLAPGEAVAVAWQSSHALAFPASA